MYFVQKTTAQHLTFTQGEQAVLSLQPTTTCTDAPEGGVKTLR